MPTHAEYMENLTNESTSSFYLIEVSSNITVQMVLCTKSKYFKLSMQHKIKETTFDYMNFLHNISTKIK